MLKEKVCYEASCFLTVVYKHFRDWDETLEYLLVITFAHCMIYHDHDLILEPKILDPLQMSKNIDMVAIVVGWCISATRSKG